LGGWAAEYELFSTHDGKKVTDLNIINDFFTADRIF